jgi:hypothetical protein
MRAEPELESVDTRRSQLAMPPLLCKHTVAYLPLDLLYYSDSYVQG